jgi:hypothetical protein
MQTNLLWTGREYYSLENCLVDIRPGQSEITSTIIGKYTEVLYKVDYTIRTNQHWETIHVEINAQHQDLTQHVILKGDGKGNWILNNKPAHEFDGCIDVDIPLTPFTNTIPIRRLKLGESEAKEISVVYCDLLQQQLKPVRQQYTRLSENCYQYENVPNDFEATIEVDDDGLVVNYPQLFVRTAKMNSNYRGDKKPTTYSLL